MVPRVTCWAVDKTLSGLMTSLKHSSVVFTVIYVLYFYFKRDKCSIYVSFDSEPEEGDPSLVAVIVLIDDHAYPLRS